ncbi:MAG TPA: rhodanese-like domain-containing protein [Acidobacteriaceae bacterium]|jgi:rhodanese-related sulfurtransferase
MKKVAPLEVQPGESTLIDVREYPEFAAGAIRGAQLVPLSKLPTHAPNWAKDSPLVLICKSGRRATQAAEKLESMGFIKVSVLEGGVDRWAHEGLPLEVASRRPWALERQVRVAAGSFIVIFSALGFTVSPRFFWGAALVGAGLIFAGVSNTCMMGTVLSKMPWNRAAERCGL